MHKNLHPQSFFKIKSLKSFQTFNRYKINIVRTRSIKIYLNTKMKVLNSNLKSKCFCDEIFNLFENEAPSTVGFCTGPYVENDFVEPNVKLVSYESYLHELIHSGRRGHDTTRHNV